MFQKSFLNLHFLTGLPRGFYILWSILRQFRLLVVAIRKFGKIFNSNFKLKTVYHIYFLIFNILPPDNHQVNEDIPNEDELQKVINSQKIINVKGLIKYILKT